MRFLAIPSGTVLSRLHYARLALAGKLGAATRRPVVRTLLLALLLAAGLAVGRRANLFNSFNPFNSFNRSNRSDRFNSGVIRNERQIPPPGHTFTFNGATKTLPEHRNDVGTWKAGVVQNVTWWKDLDMPTLVLLK